MSLRCLPLLFFNLGGEMLYVIEERLRAQQVAPDRAAKVLRDIVRALLNKRFVQELFRPQDLYNLATTRAIFDKLCHASVMKLNRNSMDKLFDLMVMSMKHQFVTCTHPVELVDITLNHLDGMARIVPFAPDAKAAVQHASKLFSDTYTRLPPAELTFIRQTFFTFLQDKHTKVSLFLKTSRQEVDGRFKLDISGPVPLTTTVPGTITYFSATGERTSTFKALKCQPTREPKAGQRRTPLGENLFGTARTGAMPPPPKSSKAKAAPEPEPEPESEVDAAAAAVGGLNLLSHLVGRDEAAQADSFKINLFTDADEDSFLISAPTPQSAAATKGAITIDTNVAHKKSAELSRIIDDFDAGSAAGGGAAAADEDDLLSLMDSA